MKKIVIISTSTALLIGFIGGYLTKSKKKQKTYGTLNIQDETDNLYLQLDYDIPEVRKKKYVVFKVNNIR